ncbi:MAG: hypothetical protein VX323_02620, partial [Pseudomonadota bacterium]|nr:hypothetical protein [Pseudomonadota bacterium]
MRDTFDAIQLQRQEMGLEGAGAGEGKPTSRAGNVDLETQLEPMIKDIVEMYVQHPPSRSKADAAESKVSDFFSVQAVPEGVDGESAESPLFSAEELTLVFNRSTSDAGEINDELPEGEGDPANDKDDADVNPEDYGEDRAGEGIAVGCLVRVVNKSSRYHGQSGIITAVVDEEEEASGEEKEGEASQPENDADADAAAAESEPVGETTTLLTAEGKKQKFRVAMTPKTPKNVDGAAELEGGFRTFDTYDASEGFGGLGDTDGGRPGTGGMDEMRRQMAALSKKVEEIMKGFAVDGEEGGGASASAAGSGPGSRVGSPAIGLGLQQRSGSNSP